MIDNNNFFVGKISNVTGRTDWEHIKREWEQGWVLMARPTSIQQYADLVGISLLDVSLPCKFCEGFLSFLDCVAFDCKGLNVIWRRGIPYGACQVCCSRLARSEFVAYYEGSVSVTEVIFLEQKPLSDIHVRCYSCLQTLSLPEKIVSGSLSLIHRVRGNWRSICMYCMPVNNEG